jgi:hypothetical protein
MTEAFQVSCVVRSQTNWGHWHITAIRTADKPGSPDRWPIAVVVGRLKGGDLFYLTGSFGDPVFVRPFRCWCGFETITARHAEELDDPVDALPSCEWSTDDATFVLPRFSPAVRPAGSGLSHRALV